MIDSINIDFPKGKIQTTRVEMPSGFICKFLNVGASILEIHVPNQRGVFENVVLNHQDLIQYLDNPSCFGATVGPLAGRVYLGQLRKGDFEFQLSKNLGKHHIHGGDEGLQHQFFTLESVKDDEVVTLVYHLELEDGLEGYPGNRHFKVKYQVYDDFKIKVTYEAISDQETWINLTHHGYFNLSGDFNTSIETHVLQLNSDKVLPISEDFLPLGFHIPVYRTPFDFRKPKTIGCDFYKSDKQLELAKGYDHPFCFSKEAMAILSDPISGRVLKATSRSAEVMVLYTMNFPVGPYEVRSGLCLEFQKPPIGLDGVFMERSFLDSGERFQHEIEFEFGLGLML